MKNYLLILSTIVLLIACTTEKKEQEKKQEAIKSVFAVNVKAKNQNQNRVFNALASSNHQIKLSFKVQGNINYFKYQIGDEVKKAELIAKLDSKPYELKVSQVKYALSEGKAALQNSKSIYERTKRLYINQNASISDIDNARASFNASNAKVQNIKKELEFAKLQLSYTKLYAPMSGYISGKYVQENENVNTGTPIVLLSDKVVDEVKVQVPENYINKIKKDDLVKVKFDSLDSNRIFSARISEISKFTASNTKTYQVTVKIKNSSNLIKSGMSADVYFKDIHSKDNNSYIVPSNCVLNDNDGYFVYVLVKEKDLYKVKRKIVEVGELSNSGYEITKGLSLDDLVLKAGMSEVYEDMKVTVSNLKDLGK